VLNVHQIVRKALADAERKGVVAGNVALAVDPPRVTAVQSSGAGTRTSFAGSSNGPRNTASFLRSASRP
jgi:hypothetical protein